MRVPFLLFTEKFRRPANSYYICKVVMTLSDSELREKPLQTKKSGFVEGCYEWTEALITALIAVMVLFVFLFRVNVVVDGSSMQPNYYDGYRLFINCVDRNFTRGNVVVIDEDGTRLPKKARIIKRVIATEGQTVDIDSQAGCVKINGKKLDESAYIQNGITTQTGSTRFPVTVPKGCVFVLGDNRTVSEDSRYTEVGMVSTKYIIGKVYFLLSPFRGFHAI